MQSLRELYKIGIGPSSSHTYGPMKIAERIKSLYPDMEKVHVDLYGSLSLTGKGHLTDKIMHPEFKSRPNRAHPLFRDFIGAAKHLRLYHVISLLRAVNYLTILMGC